MKRFLIIVFLILITGFLFYIAGLISILPSTYGEAAQIIVNDTISRTHMMSTFSAITFNLRSYDTLCGAIAIITATAGAAAVLGKAVKVDDEN